MLERIVTALYPTMFRPCGPSGRDRARSGRQKWPIAVLWWRPAIPVTREVTRKKAPRQLQRSGVGLPQKPAALRLWPSVAPPLPIVIHPPADIDLCAPTLRPHPSVDKSSIHRTIPWIFLRPTSASLTSRNLARKSVTGAPKSRFGRSFYFLPEW